MNKLKIIVTTHDKYMWALRPFAYLFNIYWSAQQPITALVESEPKFKLPSNFDTHVIDVDGEGWPKNRWTDGFIKYLNGIKEQYIVILLEDYWLNRKADTEGIRTFHEYLTFHPNVVRFDLTMDRLYAGGPQYPLDDPDYEKYGHYDIIIRPGTEYQMSLQAGMFNKGLLLELLEPGWSPWEVELLGTGKLHNSDMIVLGTRQNPVSYTNALQNRDADILINIEKIPEEHVREIKKWFPKKD
jgi:hypothetical protein